MYRHLFQNESEVFCILYISRNIYISIKKRYASLLVISNYPIIFSISPEIMYSIVLGIKCTLGGNHPENQNFCVGVF